MTVKSTSTHLLPPPIITKFAGKSDSTSFPVSADTKISESLSKLQPNEHFPHIETENNILTPPWQKTTSPSITFPVITPPSPSTSISWFPALDTFITSPQTSPTNNQTSEISFASYSTSPATSNSSSGITLIYSVFQWPITYSTNKPQNNAAKQTASKPNFRENVHVPKDKPKTTTLATLEESELQIKSSSTRTKQNIKYSKVPRKKGPKKEDGEIRSREWKPYYSILGLSEMANNLINKFIEFTSLDHTQDCRPEVKSGLNLERNDGVDPPLVWFDEDEHLDFGMEDAWFETFLECGREFGKDRDFIEGLM
ncbi:hypothetical protein HK098_003607 [Nowakowskiella sp. JEL0407]|nr:hypothetical protein HK098_003607 [Nowakowskiella sp. JEL0407]